MKLTRKFCELNTAGDYKYQVEKIPYMPTNKPSEIIF